MGMDFSFDPMKWVNQETGNVVDNQQGGQPNLRPSPPVTPDGGVDGYAQAEAVVRELERLGADITQTEPDWFHVALALANGLGEAGSELFHRVSRLYPDYSESECERKWQHALKSNDGRVSFSTFFYMAGQAGVDLKAVSGRVSATFAISPQPLGKTIEGENNDRTEVSANMPVHERTWRNGESGGNSNQYVETFSDRLNMEDIPSLLLDAMNTQQTAEQRDIVCLGSLTSWSSVCPNVYGRYGRHKVFAPFYMLIEAPAASEKGHLPACEKLVEPVERDIEQANQREREAYELAMTQWEMLDRATKKATAAPKEPPIRSLHIPLNSSATACYEALADNYGCGLSFESEADVLTQALTSDYGDYSSGLRKAFHHERISYNRRKDKEHVKIVTPKWAILLSCTPDQVPKLFSGNVANGMASRFMFYNLPRRIEWHNPFENEERTLDEQFLQLGERYYKIYCKLQQRREHPIEFTFSVEQQQQFNQFFKELQTEQFQLYGDDLVAFVRRLGLVCFRIAMVLTVLRYEQQLEQLDEPSQSIVCRNEDFRTAMTIVNCLINHTGHVYANYIGEDETVKAADGKPIPPMENQFFMLLGTEFSSDDFHSLAEHQGIAARTAERYVGNFVSKYHIAERIKNGLYRKKQV